MARENKINTRLEIIQVATRLFLERGYTNVLVSDIVGEIGISKGNLTFYFPTKEHLLAELIHRLCDFQWELMGKTAAEKNPLTAYLLEITAMTASYCENPVARELYVSAYTSQLSLEIIRENDTRKAKKIFAEYCPDWTGGDFIIAENIASGIEYSLFTGRQESGSTPDRRIAASLNAIMMVYHVPEDVRRQMIEDVLNMDYRRMGREMLEKFGQYVEEVNQKALEEAAARRLAKQVKRQPGKRGRKRRTA